MKKLLLLGLFSLILISCREDDSDKRVNSNVLPEATQNGANTGGALVDGKVWVSSTKYVKRLGGTGTYAYTSLYNTHYIQIDLRSISSKNSRIVIQLKVDDFELNKEYFLLSDYVSEHNRGVFIDGNGKAYMPEFLNTDYSGKIKITRLDIPKNIISGTFEFKAADENGNVVSITDGRFDKKFD
ncbi:MAG: DUF6252 family protein [Cruoricaptor ignavus]|nr:DUF6252 family protein [Cruoricaptor ignavus]